MFQKDDFVRIFSSQCSIIAQDVPGLFLEHLEDDFESMALDLGESDIPDIYDWWNIDTHLKDFLSRYLSRERENPKTIKNFVEETLTMMESNDNLLLDMESVYQDAGGLAQDKAATQDMLPFTDHIADYSECLMKDEKFMALNILLSQLPNVFALPTITLNPDAKELKSAFSLQVIIFSSDKTPLKPKIQALKPNKP